MNPSTVAQGEWTGNPLVVGQFGGPDGVVRTFTHHREMKVASFQLKIGAPVGIKMVPTHTGGAYDSGTGKDNVLWWAATELAALSNRCKQVYRERRDERFMRAQLMLEELGEALDAMARADEVDLTDALADLAYVVEGTACTFSLPLGWAFDEVHLSNMSKGEVRHADGVKGKGEGYQPPRIAMLLAELRKRQGGHPGETQGLQDSAADKMGPS